MRVHKFFFFNAVVPFSMRVPAFICSLFALSLIHDTAYTQQLSGSSAFSRQLDAVNWNLNTRTEIQLEALDFQLENRLSSRLFLFNGQAQNIQDEHSANLLFQYALSPVTGIAGTARTYTFTNTNLRQDAGMAGLYLRPHPSVQLTALAGLLRDERSDRRDQGFAWIARVETDPLTFGDLQLRPSASSEIAYIDPRRLQTVRYGTQLFYRTPEQLVIQSNLRLGNATRDSYQASSLLNRSETDFIESIGSDTAMVSLQIQAPVASNVFADIEVDALNNLRRITNRSLDESESINLYDSRSLRQFLDISAALVYPSDRMHLRGGVAWSFQVRESQLINTDGLPSDQVRRREEILENSNFNQRRFEVFTNNRLIISPRYVVRLSASTSIMRYDTPGINNDDRDEFSVLVRMVHQVDLTNELRASVTMAGEAFHYVYLFGERSIENNWRRSLRLIPELTWQPSPVFFMRSRFMVRANYTVDDFQVDGRQRSDQSARELAMMSTVSWTFAPDWNLEVEASRSELRIGRLFWNTFEETPIDTLVTWDVRPMLSKRTGQAVISSGIRYFQKIDFLPQASIQIEVPGENGPVRVSRISTGRQVTRQWGPAVLVRLPVGNRHELYINGWYQMQRTRRQLYITYPEEFREAFLQEERRAVQRVFPNLEMMVRFRF